MGVHHLVSHVVEGVTRPFDFFQAVFAFIKKKRYL